MTETSAVPWLSNTSTTCRHFNADVPLTRVLGSDQPFTIRFTTSGCVSWPDLPGSIVTRDGVPLVGMVVVDDGSDAQSWFGVMLDDVRVDRGTALPPQLPATYSYLPACVVLPEHFPQAEISAQRQMRELLAMTHWSHRAAAAVLGTSHVTVGKIAAEGASARSSDVAGRLAAVHACVRRLNPLASDAEALRTALESPVDVAGMTAVQLLAEGQYARAYRTALGVLTPVPDRPLLRSRPNASRLRATVAVDTADDE